ncbi:MAG: SDR family NAD(P)-dependent oxidoreductase [Candidatus Cloacimonetes bacterium]|nr:SDR family NAD(P)-dependent oxidoreductase [Candidatus Cloacimonadota bacterium]
MDLQGKNIIITGASSGIGKTCAIECSKAGAKVHLIARNLDKLNEVSVILGDYVHTVNSLDVTRSGEIEPLVRSIVDTHGKIDGFIHSAGIQTTVPIRASTSDSYISLYRVNAVAAYEFARSISLKNIRSPRGASIVFISSIMSIVANPGLAAYCSSKTALLGAARSMALELAKHKIRVNCVSPGFISDSAMMHDDLQESLSQSEIDELKKGYPLGLGETIDVAKMCIFLLSDDAKWITGQNIVIDGGYTIK